ncbi:MAG: phospholipase D-like domain-containing protein [Chitinophagaceae bacterium]|nr:phospholipase D-like domain-containing protein [Chitinophagaceae bacterium]
MSPGEYTHLNRASLLKGGREYFDALLRGIETALDYIHLQVYILHYDETGKLVIDALMNAAQRGVKVFVVVDGYASQTLPRRVIREMRVAGIAFRFFEPFFKSRYFYFGRRLHHKVFVVDGRFAIVGGINVADRYNDIHGHRAWLDFALEVEGQAALQLCVLCWKTWKGFPRKMGLTPCEKESPRINIAPEDAMKVRLRRNDWVRRKNEISASYVQMFRRSQREICILSSYFLPGKFIRKMLTEAVNRGVKITIITAGTSDVRVAKHAERWLYDWLLRNKITLYEYQPSILHAKLALCDGEWMTIGSYNVNNISAYASIELNLDVRNNKLVESTQSMLAEIIEKRLHPHYP